MLLYEPPPGSAREHDRALDLLDRLRDFDAARAGFGAVERRPAPPDAVDLVQDLEALGGGLVTAVEDEPVRVDYGGRTVVLALAPEHRTAGGAARAQYALGGVVVAGAVGRALDPLAGRRVAAGDQVGLDRSVRVEERLHVDNQVLLHRQPADRFDRDGERLARLLGEQIAHQHLAGQSVDAVDAHAVGAAHAVRTGSPEGQRPVEVALDVDQQVEHAVAGQAGYPKALPATGFRECLGLVRVEPGDLHGHHHRALGDRRQGRFQRDLWFDDVACSHQYFRSLGS